MLRSALVKLLDVAAGFCAAFFAGVAVAGLIGMALAGPQTEGRTCWPQYSVFGLIQTDCESAAADALWWGTVESARFVVVIPSLAFGFLMAAIKTGDVHWLLEASIWVLFSVPIGLLSWAGFRHWRAHAPRAAWVLLVMFVGQIVVSAVRL